VFGLGLGPGASGIASPGKAHSSQGCRGVSVPREASLQSAINRRGAGTTFCIGSGIHRLSAPVVAKDRDTFIGKPGAVLDGSSRLTSFAHVGPFWVAKAPASSADQGEGECASRSPGCLYPNQVFFDNRPLRRATERSRLSRLDFYVDDATHELFLARDPQGHKVEIAVSSGAFKGWGTGVTGLTIRGLTIQKFANPAGRGAINGRPSWRVIGNVVRLNHGIGVQDASTIRGNRIIKNGQLGIMISFGSHVLIERNIVAYNNAAGFDSSWEAGGIKFVRSNGVILRRNRVVANDGPGIWADGDDIHIRYERNLISRNSGPGILHEISYNAVITRNTVSRNGSAASGWVDGAGILLNASGNVEISHNVVSKNADGIGITQTDRGSGKYGPYESRNDRVVGNVITMTHGHTGLVQNVGDTSYYTGKNNVFQRNIYYLGCAKDYFAWEDPSGRNDYSYVNRKRWQAAGNDHQGRFHSIC
jgi:parallel beta-helix repeat protein